MLTAMFALALAMAPQDVSAADAAACTTLTQARDATAAKLPMMLNDVTRFDEVHVDCAARSMTMVKTVTDPAATSDGWRERAQAELEEIVCTRGLKDIARLGWKFAETMRFPAGDEVTVTVLCPQPPAGS